MCGIFGMANSSNSQDDSSAKRVLAGLRRLEYRGYDSWGIAGLVTGERIPRLQIVKETGQIGRVTSTGLPNTAMALGHTRWATHGKVTQKNAHPHLASDGSFALAQNGVVENFETLKRELVQRGYEYISETDTEVIVRLIEEERKTTQHLREAVRKAFL